MFNAIFNFFIDLINNFLNFLIDLVASTLSIVANLLPNFSLMNDTQLYHSVETMSSNTDFFGYLNWLVDVGSILNITIALWGAYSLFFVFSVLLRWLKVIN
ncbi:MAG: hypothetical protein ACRDD4_13215 [Culicoidibacterales bacterium]